VVYKYAGLPTTYAMYVVVAKPHGSTAFCSLIRGDRKGRMIEAGAAVENGGTEILSNNYNFEGVAAVSGIIRRGTINSSG
jgi:hypothetical protein